MKNTIILLIIKYNILIINSYNIGTKNFKLIQNPSQTNSKNSYFGFSVGLASDFKDNWLLVGCPKCNRSYSTSAGSNNLIEPGGIFGCDLRTTQPRCHQIPIDPTGNVLGPDASWMDDKNHQWLGVSLDVNSKDSQPIIATCGHRWINQLYKYNGMIFMNGVCYWKDLKTLFQDQFTSSWNKLIPLKDLNKQNVINPVDRYTDYYYHSGQAGISTHIKKDGNVLFGAPGILMWSGSFVEMSRISSFSPNPQYKRDLNDFNKQTRGPIIVKNDIPHPSDLAHNYDYLGYSVSSGNFWNEEELIVVGAPRAKYTGMVYIVKSEKLSTPNVYGPTKIKIEWEAKGTQDWSYFGGVVTAIDVNGDGRDEIIVGAPLYSREKMTPSEDGAVWIYSFPIKDKKQYEVKKILSPVGSGNRARFGSCISSIGDIDVDGFKDVAIGSPLEDEGRGTIYIFRGSKHGLQINNYQKITASKLNKNLRGFGTSISKGIDIDTDNLIDIAVGAPDSETVIVLKTCPIVRFKGDIKPNKEYISEQDNCFELEICMSYSGVGTGTELAVEVDTELDSTRGLERPRAYFKNVNSKFNILLKRNSIGCKILPACLTETGSLAPLEITSKFTSNGWTDDADLCHLRDMIDPSTELEVKANIMITTECFNTMCKPELHFDLQYKSANIPYIINGGEILTILTTLKVKTNKAYGTWMRLEFPKYVDISFLSLQCQVVQNTEQLILDCTYPNSIEPDINIDIENSFKINGYAGSVDTIEINVSYGAMDVDTKNKIYSIPVKNSFNIDINGNFEPEILPYDLKENIDGILSTKFKLNVNNYGVTPIKETQIEIGFPHKYLADDGNWHQIFLNDIMANLLGSLQCETKEDLESNICAKPPEYIGDGHQLVCGNPGVKYIRQQCIVYDLGSFESNTPLYFNASSILGTIFQKNTTVALEVQLFINQIGLPNLQDTSGDIVNIKKSVWLLLVPENWKLPPVKPKSIPWWVYLLATLGGLLLLVGIIAILIKLGFFNRRKMETNETNNEDNLVNQNGEMESENKIETEDTDMIIEN